MEVEVKLRLPSREAHAKVASLLAAGHKATHAQENYFFDGANGELNAQRIVMRVRFYDVDKKALLTVKGKMVVKDGIGRASEVEELVEPSLARSFLSDPSKLLQHPSPIITDLRAATGVQALKPLGGFRNTRQVIDWEGHTLELDETVFEHGTLYEIECETSEPEALRDRLEAFLNGVGVPYSYSGTTKFANFIKKTLD